MIALRPAGRGDREQVFAWNFAADVRAASRDARLVTPAEHARWFESRLERPDPMWIVVDGGVEIGVVRIDLLLAPLGYIGSLLGEGRISIALAAQARGRGLGRRAIAAACAAWQRPVVAEILAGNAASRTCFEACDFSFIHERDGLVTYQWRPMQTSQLALWRSEFGRDYTDRNDHEKPERIASWRRLLCDVAPASVLEVGCNVGWNLEYLRRLGVPADGIYGIEPQAQAVERARVRGFEVAHGTAFDLPFGDAAFDLAFTSGVLIHISPATIGAALDEIYRVARRWIVAIEYDAPTETEVHYRGHTAALWKRDHGALWRTRHPDLRPVRSFALGAADGYDDCTAHLFEKVS